MVISTRDWFTSRQTKEIVGISYRQLDHWDRTGLVKPSRAEARGSGSRRRYSYGDLLELKIVKKLLDSGMSLKGIRRIFNYLRENLKSDIVTANLVIDGSSVVLVGNDEELIDLLQNGQGVLNVLPLSAVKKELDAAVIDLFPPELDAAERADDTGFQRSGAVGEA